MNAQMAPDVGFDDATALIVVDVQNDFADPRGSLYVEEGDRIVPVVNELVAAARRAGAVVAYTQDWHPERTAHFAVFGGLWPVHCVQGTWGAELHPDLRVEGEVIRKGVHGEDGYSGFTAQDLETGETLSTGLREVLDRRRIHKVVVAGLAEDVCIKATALDAVRLGYTTIVPLAATRPVNPDEQAISATREELQAAGVELR